MSSSRSSLLLALYGGHATGSTSTYAPVASSGDMENLVPMCGVDALPGPSRRPIPPPSKIRWPKRYFKDQVVSPLLGHGSIDSSEGDEDGLRSNRSSTEQAEYDSLFADRSEKLLPLFETPEQLHARRTRRRRWAYAATALIFALCAFLTWQIYARLTKSSDPRDNISRPVTFKLDPSLTQAVEDDKKYTQPSSLEHGDAALKSECCNPTYNILPDAITPVKSLQSMTELQLDDWIANGKIPSRGVDLSRHARIDGVTMWVNGSDPRHKSARKFFSRHRQISDVPSTKTLQPRLFPHHRNGSRQFSGYKSVKDKAVKSEDKPVPFLQNSDNHYRELNELLYNVRTARANLHEHLGTHHIISTDFWEASDNYTSTVARVNETTHFDAGLQDRKFAQRRGQLPQWLNTKSKHVALGQERAEEPVAVRMHHDWETFVPLVMPAGEDKAKAIEQWRSERLPTFSSTAAEAVLGVNLPGASEAFFLSSDDMLITNKATTADFYTPLFGPVMHMEMQRVYHGSDNPVPGDEHAGHEFSVGLLHRRFGVESQAYPAHMVKGQLQPLVLETRIIFRQAFEKATAGRFRGKGITANAHMLGYGTVIERHREALIWSFFVAKIDTDGDGMLSKAEFAGFLDILGAGNNASAIVRVDTTRHRRYSTHESHISPMLERARFPKPLQSTYRFSSFDGYPYTFPYAGRFYKRNLGEMSDQQKRAVNTEGVCKIELAKCLPRIRNGGHVSKSAPLDMSVDAIFKRFAFDKHECGSCLVQHLVGQSGKKGLEAFLPEAQTTFPGSKMITAAKNEMAKTDYHLPLTDDWRKADFSLQAVAKDNAITRKTTVSRRAFAVSLIARYNYVIADAASEFVMMRGARNAEVQLDKLETSFRNRRTRFAFLCVNDDVGDDVDAVRQVLHAFFVRLWPSKIYRLPFERQPAVV